MLTANIEGLITRNKPKKQVISEMALERKIDVICLTEIHLNGSFVEAEVHMDKYILYRADRSQGRKKGGVAIYLRKSIAATAEMLVSHSNSYVEIVVIYIRDSRVMLATIYRPPLCPRGYFEEALILLRTAIEERQEPMPELIITGDFNLPNADWEDRSVYGGRVEQRAQAELMFNLMEEYCMCQEVNHPTRHNSKLDLLFANNDELIQSISVETTTLLDHDVVVAETNIKDSDIPETFGKSKRNCIGFEDLNFWSPKVEWDKIKSDIAATDWAMMTTEDPQNVEEMYDSIMEKILSITLKYVPRKVTHNSKCKIPRDRKLLIRKRAKVARKIERSNSASNIKQMKAKVDRIEEQIVQSHVNEKKLMEGKAIEAIQVNPKYFYKYAKKHSSVRANIGPLVNAIGEAVGEMYYMAELLRQQYERVYSSPVKSSYVTEVINWEGDTLSDISLVSSDLLDSIREVRDNSAAGPDGFPAKLLRNCAAELCVPLLRMWELSFQAGNIPTALKKAVITLIYKGGERKKAENYRPMALTSHLIKIFEKVIVKKLVEHFDTRIME